jgi:hypothetical protein
MKGNIKQFNGIEFEEIVILPEFGKRASVQREEPKKIALNLFDIYPNPASDYAYFTFKTPDDVGKSYMTVYDNSGKLVEQIDLKDVKNIYRLEVSNYSSGIYTVTFGINENIITTKNFVVQK